MISESKKERAASAKKEKPKQQVIIKSFMNTLTNRPVQSLSKGAQVSFTQAELSPRHCGRTNFISVVL